MVAEAKPGTCRVCGNEAGNREHVAREMMFGLRESFRYLECGWCGCLQIAEIPGDLHRHYSSDYYSFTEPDQGLGEGALGALRRSRDRFAITGKGLLGRALHVVKPAPVLRSLAAIELDSDSRILDVGSGTGILLHDLHRAGYCHVLGIDPYLDGDRTSPDGPAVLKRTLDEVEPGWNVIMFHHSYEHVPDPETTLRVCARLLSPGGTCMIRMPDAGGEAWRRYGVNWVGLDPPRHLHVFTARGLQVLAGRAGLEIVRVIHDSDDFQFWASEQYLRDVPLFSPASHLVAPSGSGFTRRRIRQFRKEARRLNAAGLGDQAAFYLRRAEGAAAA